MYLISKEKDHHEIKVSVALVPVGVSWCFGLQSTSASSEGDVSSLLLGVSRLYA